MIGYCKEIFDTQEYFGNSQEYLNSNFIYKNAISMSILQIGELSGHLSKGFTEKHNTIPWRNIKGIRNFMAHEYGNLDVEILWETIVEDIPELYKYCNNIVKKIEKNGS